MKVVIINMGSVCFHVLDTEQMSNDRFQKQTKNTKETDKRGFVMHPNKFLLSTRIRAENALMVCLSLQASVKYGSHGISFKIRGQMQVSTLSFLQRKFLESLEGSPLVEQEYSNW